MKHQKKMRKSEKKWEHDMFDKIETENNKKSKKLRNINKKWKHVHIKRNISLLKMKFIRINMKNMSKSMKKKHI